MIDPNHPRAISLKIRDKVVQGVKNGITSLNGLIAQGRGEAFDYLIGEKTQNFAEHAIKTAVAMLISAKHPVLSINGNCAALAAKEYVKLSKILDCPIEVNLFHRTQKRELAVRKLLKTLGAKKIVGTGKNASFKIKGIASKRKMVSKEGIANADVVLVPLEDGDRTEALVAMGKTVITIDLNPLSRTAQKAHITIVDNLVRAMPRLIEEIKKMKEFSKEQLERITKTYDNKRILSQSLKLINQRLSSFTS